MARERRRGEGEAGEGRRNWHPCSGWSRASKQKNQRKFTRNLLNLSTVLGVSTILCTCWLNSLQLSRNIDFEDHLVSTFDISKK